MAATGRTSRTTRSAAKAPDAILLAAVDHAREAIAAEADASHVGEHEGHAVEGERLLTHYFTCLSKGYRGWRWAVTVARAPRAKLATVSEVVLLPGAEAILPPTWVPWADRLAPGDLGDTDTLPYRADDPRLEPGYAATDGSDDDPDADRLAVWELGLGRPRVLSRLGRDEAAERWFDGPHGPTSESALHAPCLTCGFYLPLAGSLRQVFGVCANEWSPDDGQVVSTHHGCGAHSETDVEQPQAEVLPDLILDEIGSDSITFVPRGLSKNRDADPGDTAADQPRGADQPGDADQPEEADQPVQVEAVTQADAVAEVGPVSEAEAATEVQPGAQLAPDPGEPSDT